MPDSLRQRFGFDRLSVRSRPDVDAGLAMAATGLLAVVCWVLASALVLVTDAGTAVTGASTLTFAATFGALFAPFAVATSFVLGTYCWRVVDRDGPVVGALLGACTAVGGMVGGSVGLSIVFAGVNLWNGTLAPGEVLIVSLVTVVSALLFVVVFTGWLFVPLGAAGGWYHERSKRTKAAPNDPS